MARGANIPVRRGLAGASAVVLAAVLAAGGAQASDEPAGAQAAAASAPAAQTGPAQVAEVVVHAQRRAEKVQDVPIQITVLSGQTLANASARTTQDALNMVPNVTMDHSFTFLNSFVIIRGVQEINNADSPLSIVVDGVPQNNQKEALLDLLDVEQIEVLRGPQGGLYGRNAIGGAMLVTTKMPANTFEGVGQIDYGNGDYFQAQGTVSGPIVADKLLFRLSADVKGDGGRIDNSYLHKPVDGVNHDDTLQGRLVARPTNWLTLDLRARYNSFRGGSTWDSVVFSGKPNDIEPPSSDLLGQAAGYVEDGVFKFDARLGFATLTGITGYTKLNEDYRGSLDFTNPVENPGGFLGLFGPIGQGQNLNVNDVSQELRLVSASDQRFRWLIGAYYIHDERNLFTRAYLDPMLSRGAFDNPALAIINREETDSNWAWAVYGQADYDLTSFLTLTGALRYDDDHRRQLNPATGAVQSADFTQPQPKVTLTWKLDRERLLYATYSTGFRSGGFNGPGVSIPAFKAESLTNWETGFKSSWLDRRLVLNGDVFYAVDHDYQFFFVDAATASQIIGNLNAVHIWGVELESQARLAQGLDLFGSLGTTSTDIRRSTEFLGVVGNHTPKTIPWKLNLALQYVRPLADDLNGFFRVDYEHRAKEYWQIDNLDIQNPVDLVNMKVGVRRGPYELYLWGRNLTDMRYYEDYNPSKFSGLPYDIGSLAEPRSYGVELKARF